MRFADRIDAGRKLAERLQDYRSHRNGVVLGLPRGGVVVAFEVARAIDAPLDIFPVRKLGLPGHEELAMGAIAGTGERVINDDVVSAYGISSAEIERVATAELKRIQQQQSFLRGDAPAVELTDRCALLIDDGAATGATMRAAVVALRTHGTERIVVAVPVASPEAAEALERIADEFVCLNRPEAFASVGSWYDDFSQATDEDVRDLLLKSGIERKFEAYPPVP